MRISSLASVSLALIYTLSSPRIAPAQPPAAAIAPLGLWEVCWFVAPGDRLRPPVYVSGAVPMATSADYQGIARAFSKYLLATRTFPPGMEPSPTCVQGKSPALALAGIKEPGTVGAPNQYFPLDCTRANCVKTDWVYADRPAAAAAPAPTAAAAPPPNSKPRAGAPPSTSPQPAAPAATPAPPKGAAVATAAAAPSQTPYAVCLAESSSPPKPTVYLGDPFDGTEKDTAAWTKAYRAALNDKYGRASAGPIRCNTLKSLDAAQAYVQKTKETLGPSRTIIETGWKYP
jgi:hypothetical protein